ncbi:sce7726 family protein [Anaerostipes sp.]|uniref:sce7726 family protein n=1 Tax=Anaerostipes sp. TaxID=1872530 RepID=UPI0025C68657|nr:sce7726 family protein [Anaerostipes sp.]MBS7006824.1 sce7726 family protein [Anaerostipes sp.]
MLYDKDIREPLFDFLEERYAKIRIIEEKQMGRSRADIVMVTEDSVFGIEIKSDADTYARLQRQIRDYDQFFDYNYAVVGSRHALHIEEKIPAWWGIITAEETGDAVDFYMLRSPGENPKLVWKNKLRLLWRPELAHIQERNQLPKYRQKSKAFVIDKIIEKVPAELLKTQVSDELFERDYHEIENTIRTYKAGGTG